MPAKKQPIEKICPICGDVFWVQPYRSESAKTCNRKCANTLTFRATAAHRGNVQRFRGEGKGYPKLNGRHAHRVMAEQKLGRKLLPGEIVHHENRNKQDFSCKNLEVLPSQSEHARTHWPEMFARRKEAAGY